MSGPDRSMYPRVTEIIGEWHDFSYVDKDVLHDAALRGSYVHAICACELQHFKIYEGMGEDFERNCEFIDNAYRNATGPDCVELAEIFTWGQSGKDAARPYFESFMLWLKNIESAELVETRLYSDKYRFTGQIDAVVKYHDEEDSVIVDFKTSSSYSPYWRPQIAAYGILCDENGIKFKRAGALMLKKTGKVATFRDMSDSLKNDRPGFLAAQGAWKYFNGLKKGTV
jgi:hypothetical protein